MDEELKLMDAAPAQLDAKRDEPEGQSQAESLLGSDGGEVCSGESSEETSHYEAGKDCRVVITCGDLKAASDE